MSKEKKPRKRKNPVKPVPVEPPVEVERPTPEAAVLVRERPRPALFHLIEGLRLAVGALLDLADTMAETIQGLSKP